jgi:hypothetical protein
VQKEYLNRRIIMNVEMKPLFIGYKVGRTMDAIIVRRASNIEEFTDLIWNKVQGNGKLSGKWHIIKLDEYGNKASIQNIIKITTTMKDDPITFESIYI